MEKKLQTFVDNFSKCAINFTYQNFVDLTNQDSHSVVNIVKEAIDLYEHHQPDLVLMDIRMPKIDGITAGKKIMFK